jgi:hypothetical protein
MEKVIYLVWFEPHTSRSAVSDVLLGVVAPELLALDPHRLSMDVRDTHCDIAAPVPTPEGETPLHGLVSVWVDTVEDSSPYGEILTRAATRVAGYSVVESLYRDYGDNQWSAPRSWPDGQRSPGPLTVALLQQHPTLTHEEWMTRWHTHISPVTESIQPRCRYVRNAVFRGITNGAPPMGGIVEEAWPSLEHVTDPMLFFCADGDPERMRANIELMLAEITAFTELDTFRSATMSEWILKS